jgi:uncharacterized membrane protein
LCYRRSLCRSWSLFSATSSSNEREVLSLLLLVLAIVLFLLAAFIAAVGGDIGVAPNVLAYFGLASFAAAHLPV